MAPDPLLERLESNAAQFLTSLSICRVDLGPIGSISSQKALRNDAGVNDKIAQYGTDILLIERIQDTLIQAKAQLQLQRARVQTALAPVSMLPPEILRLIFRAAWDDAKDPTKTILSASRMCTVWRSVALDCSELWTKINVAWPHNQQRAWLSRARTHPLDVLWKKHHSRGTFHPCEDFWDTNSRWRSLRLIDTEDGATRKFVDRLMLQEDLSLLTSLWLQPRQPYYTGFSHGEAPQALMTMSNFNSALPRLRSLSVSFIPIAELHVITQTLVHLRIHNIDRDAAEWLTLLDSCTSVQLLVISAGSISSSQVTKFEGVITLPALESLSLERTSATTLHFLSQFVHMPNLHILHFDYPDDRFDHPMFLDSNRRYISQFLHNCTQVTHLQIARPSWIESILEILSNPTFSTPPPPYHSTTTSATVAASSNYPSTSIPTFPRTESFIPLLPNLKSLRLNTDCTARVTQFLMYRLSLVSSGLIPSGNSYSGRSVPGGPVWALHKLGLINLPERGGQDHKWVSRHVEVLEFRSEGWGGLDDEFMERFEA